MPVFDSRELRRSVTRPARLGVFISGSGRTLCSIHDLITRGGLDARIALVVASRACTGVERARDRGLQTVVERGRIAPVRLERLLTEHGIDWIILAGYLQLLPVVPGFSCRVVNIHPALLPRHGGVGMYGDRVHAAVLASGERVSGCTVHLCDEEFDRGSVVLQRTCPVLPGDDVRALAARVFALEREAYEAALRLLIG